MFSPALEAELEAELGRSGAEYTVIRDPKDTRQRITPTTVEPFRHVCQIKGSLPDPTQRGASITLAGTGTLVAPNKVLTAAHVVYRRDHKKFAQDVRVVPAKDGTGTGPRHEPYGSAVAVRLDVPPDYLSGSVAVAAANDYAVITLAERVSDRRPRDPELGTEPLGWWRRLVAASEGLLQRNLEINNAGYPGDKGGNRLYHTRNTLADTTPYFLLYLNDTATGQSGGPLWLPGDQRPLIGVHTDGFERGKGNTRQNSGVRLTAANLAVIENWLRT